MQRSTRILGGVLGAAVLLGLGAGSSAPEVLAGDPCYHGYELAPQTVGPGTDIKAMPCAFEPPVTTIPVGGTVTFHNGPEVAHLVTGANQTWGDRDVELAAGATISYTFDEAGIYPYACALHRGMSGAIVVGDGGPALATTLDAGTADNAAGSAAAATASDPTPATADTGAGTGAIAAGLALLLAVGSAAALLLGRRRRRPVTRSSGESLRA